MAARQLKIIFWNAQGASSKQQELRAFLTENNVDVALLSETFLKPSHTYNIPNYSTFRTDRLQKHGGGTAILIKKDINHDILDIHTTNMETTSLRVHTNKGPITLHAAYSPPNSNIEETDLDTAFCTQQATILAGDLNAKHHNWNSKITNSKGRQLKTLAERKLITIDAPTDDTHIHTPTGTSDVLDIALLRNLTVTYHMETINGPIFRPPASVNDSGSAWEQRTTHYPHYQLDHVQDKSAHTQEANTRCGRHRNCNRNAGRRH